MQSAVPEPVKPVQQPLRAQRKITKHEPQRSPELEAFYQEIKDCQRCPLGKTRTNFVFGVGHPQARVMFIGEAPGQDEDLQGIPFVGRAGKLLDKMLQAIGMRRDDVYIANVLKCRPPGNRDPLPDEIVECEPYLKKQLEMIKPRVLVALGRVSGKLLTKEEKSLRELRQNEADYEGIPLVVTYHPAALLRNPQWKQYAWEDFKKIRHIAEEK
ncbi:MAG TPA: uracil-DNA glycosylase [Caldithrix abyssi]|uniref:Type-4 uracil-DNA glycosylase n=1 Tax=Caldithrix abyssi TaxID=187145 RepID=A0A7V4U2D2_CALAY|nr:uracil-DNA glycosylase [Caldithrix abyssi]